MTLETRDKILTAGYWAMIVCVLGFFVLVIGLLFGVVKHTPAYQAVWQAKCAAVGGHEEQGRDRNCVVGKIVPITITDEEIDQWERTHKK